MYAIEEHAWATVAQNAETEDWELTVSPSLVRGSRNILSD